MIYNKNQVPSEGEVLIATVKQVFDYGSYVSLDEYGNIQAFLPWSEISSRWVKNIRDIVKEGRKIVVKVIRVDRKKGTIDVSLKKVTEDEKRKKTAQWKKLQKIDKMIEIVSQKLGKNEKEGWEKVIWKLEDKYGDAYDALIKAVEEGDSVLRNAGVEEVWIKPLMDEIGKHIEEKKVKVSEVITLRTSDPAGIEKIKKILGSAVEMAEEADVDIKIYTIGAPRYRIDIIGSDAKELSRILTEMLDKIKKLSKDENVEFGVAKK